ncbi:MAG: hypothetical protein DRP79_08360 [Planctomycetota bacterium]|nr:MAG: hypothetical protein DRP79_08360 [Planctomycetota bacterium]
MIDIAIAFIVFLIVLAIVGLVILWYKRYVEGDNVSQFVLRFEGQSWYERLVMNIILPFSYFTNGQTIGKKIMHIRVVSPVRERLTLKDSFERAFAYSASFV